MRIAGGVVNPAREEEVRAAYLRHRSGSIAAGIAGVVAGAATLAAVWWLPISATLGPVRQYGAYAGAAFLAGIIVWKALGRVFASTFLRVTEDRDLVRPLGALEDNYGPFAPTLTDQDLWVALGEEARINRLRDGLRAALVASDMERGHATQGELDDLTAMVHSAERAQEKRLQA